MQIFSIYFRCMHAQMIYLPLLFSIFFFLFGQTYCTGLDVQIQSLQRQLEAYQMMDDDDDSMTGGTPDIHTVPSVPAANAGARGGEDAGEGEDLKETESEED